MKEHLVNYITNNETPFMVVDLDHVVRNYTNLRDALPNVVPYYAIKAFPSKEVVAELHAVGCNFDVASNGEIDILKAVGVNADRTIHTHPIKNDKTISTALQYGIKTFVIDNVHELYKFEKYKSECELLIRVCFRSKTAVVDLSKKFGCSIHDVGGLIAQAKLLGIKISGLSFHVGSQTLNADDHVAAINACIPILKMFNLEVLDIGGGFPVSYLTESLNIFDFCKPINEALTQVPESVSLYCEPGRYMVGECCDVVTSVVGMTERDGKKWYYLDDGVYGMFSGIIYDHVNYPLEYIPNNGGQLYNSVLAGPTCDSIDVIADDILIPSLDIGSIIVGSTMGAYTFATASTFNSLPIPDIFYFKNNKI